MGCCRAKKKVEINYKEGNLSVDIENTEIEDLLNKIGKRIGAEVIIENGLEGNIEKQQFENVPLMEALQKLVRESGFSVIVEYKNKMPVKIIVSKNKEKKDWGISSVEEAIVISNKLGYKSVLPLNVELLNDVSKNPLKIVYNNKKEEYFYKIINEDSPLNQELVFVTYYPEQNSSVTVVLQASTGEIIGTIEDILKIKREQVFLE